MAPPPPISRQEMFIMLYSAGVSQQLHKVTLMQSHMRKQWKKRSLFSLSTKCGALLLFVALSILVVACGSSSGTAKLGDPLATVTIQIGNNNGAVPGPRTQRPPITRAGSPSTRSLRKTSTAIPSASAVPPLPRRSCGRLPMSKRIPLRRPATGWQSSASLSRIKPLPSILSRLLP